MKMRNDAIGLFWEDRPPEPKPKSEKKAKQKSQPPEPVWLSPDYLPGLAEAKAFPLHVMSLEELYNAWYEKHELVYDIESYENYFIASFRSVVTGHCIYFELSDTKNDNLDTLKWILENFVTIGFNSLKYDLIITQLALHGYDCKTLKQATKELIELEERPRDLLKRYKVPFPKYNHIDLIEVAPLRSNLKTYGGRVHTPKMQDLPFHPDTVLSEDQKAIVKWYNINADLTSTAFLFTRLLPQLELRKNMSEKYGIDLRSRSDAQIAEAVMGHEYYKLTGVRPQVPTISPDMVYRYNVPHFLKFKTPLMNSVLKTIADSYYQVDEFRGSIKLPDSIANMRITIGESVYKIGIGGLHSSEKNVSHVANHNFKLKDWDVASFYPSIILNLGLYPQHLGTPFLQMYQAIVTERLTAKHAKNKVVADALKIVINGTYGKLGSKYSIFYSPDLLIQVTLTGQLSLLMLIERLELAGVPVISANTDGIVVKEDCQRIEEIEAIMKQWQIDTGFELEDTEYKAIYSRDVNNYVAVKTDGKFKTKGAFGNPWAENDVVGMLKKNPANIICMDAVCAYLDKGTPVDVTIKKCSDIRKFVTVRNVKGGSVKVEPDTPPVYLGKSVRWYYGKGTKGQIVYASNGNKVPRSDGAVPALELPQTIPQDLDYDWYINEAYNLLEQLNAA
jgi:hypothetical protein